jgi:type VI protein secretion system component Hcp
MKNPLFRNKLMITIIIMLLSAAAISSAEPAKTRDSASFNSLELRMKTTSGNYIDITDVVSFTWDLSNNVGSGSGRMQGPVMEPLVINKAINQGSTILAEYLVTGKLLSEVTVTLKVNTNKGATSTYRIILENVAVIALSQEGNLESGFSEEIAFSYENFKLEWK